MKILADFHHGCLWESEEILFSDRFGWDLYRPIGMEWFDAGIWKHEIHHPGNAVTHQYLDRYDSDRDCGGHYVREDWSHPGRVHKLLTLEQARSQKIDIVLGTLLANEPGMCRLAREIGAKFGVQVGNQLRPDPYGLADFVMLSTTTNQPPVVPFTIYHQEFSLEDYRFEYPPGERDLAATWVHGLGGTPWLDVFARLANAVPELQWKAYGHKEDHQYWAGSISPCPKVAESMRSARVGVHFKSWGDGMGHVVHNLFACGKPVVGSASYYADKLAGPLFVDGVTSIDVQTHTLDEVAAWAKRLALDDEFHYKVSQASYQRFKAVVNFEEDAEKVRRLVESVL